MSSAGHNQNRSQRSTGALLLFAAFHLLVFAGGVTWAYFRFRATQTDPPQPEFLEKPIILRPLYNRAEVISDADLQRVLHKLRPQLRGPQPRINYVDHALRFWGVEARFRDPQSLSGEEMRAILTDHRLFAREWGDKTPSLLIDTLRGVGTRTQQGGATSSHVDHTVASLAEVGTPLDFPLITPEGEQTFQSMLQYAVDNFSLNQTEYEWTAMVFALYRPTADEWRTREGQWISFDRLAERIMRQKFLDGVCFGNHRLYSLVILLRVDEKQRILSPEMKQRVIEHLNEATRRLMASQAKEGYWDQNWEGTAWSDSWNETPALSRRILATGHALEWWAMAPKEVQPPPDVVRKAGRWLSKTIQGMSDSQIRSGYTFLTHAGRALALWRGRFPHEVYRLGKAE